MHKRKAEHYHEHCNTHQDATVMVIFPNIPPTTKGQEVTTQTSTMTDFLSALHEGYSENEDGNN